jgi:hypothetical protein
MKAAPGWKAATEELKDMEGVVFADVECGTGGNGAICRSWGAGQGGWPTIKAVSQYTPAKGNFYKQKQSGAVCDELKVPANMKAYVLEAVSQTKAEAAKRTGGGEL